MKKIFSFVFAALASMSLFAADYTPAAVYTVGDATTLGAKWSDKGQTANYFESGDTVIFNAYILKESGAAGYQEWTGNASGGSTDATWSAMPPFQGNTAWGLGKAATARNSRIYYYNVTNCETVMLYGKTGGSGRQIYLKAYEIINGAVSSEVADSVAYTVNTDGICKIDSLDYTKAYRIVVISNNSSNSSIYEIAFVAHHSTEPSLNASVAAVTLNATALNPVDSVKVTFTGRNLPAGDYTLTVPNVADMTFDPASVTVAADGSLKAAVTIKYAPTANVDEAVANLALAIDTLSAAVTINYSSSVATKKYMESINIEQLVLDHGTGYSITDTLTNANYEYANLNSLDTLNASKDNCNVGYLGLKIKTAGGYIQGLLKENDVVNIKFGYVDAAAPVQVLYNGTAIDTITASYNEVTYTIPAEGVCKLVTLGKNTAVIKQIMVNEAIKTVTLPDAALVSVSVSANDATMGSAEVVTAPYQDGKYLLNSQVTVKATANEGYVFTAWSDQAADAEYTFKASTNTELVAIFAEEPTAINNTTVLKAAKVIENGQVVIIREGVRYNALGTKME